MVTKSSLHCNTYTPNKGENYYCICFLSETEKGATCAVLGTHYFILYSVLSI